MSILQLAQSETMAPWLYCTATCIVLLVSGSVVHATLLFSNFSSAALNSVIFTDSVLFDLNNNNTGSNSSSQHKVRSFLDCARRCAYRDGCEAFTYVKDTSGVDSCRGHFKKMTSADAHGDVIGARTYDMTGQKRVPEPDPCEEGNYLAVDDLWRNIQGQVSGRYCDHDAWTPGWYRFFLNGADADMLTTCPPRPCATDMALWLDLQGKALPEAGEELTTTTCAYWQNKCCYDDSWGRPVTVRNCSTFYVYNVPTPAVCIQAYCVRKRP